MRIKLHEIELGSGSLQHSKHFYQDVLGLSSPVDQPGLTVFDVGINNLDLNFSSHLPAGNILLSFLCDDLVEVMQLLTKKGISYEGPATSHLGMISISFKDPNGYSLKINQATADSPEWLRNSFD